MDLLQSQSLTLNLLISVPFIPCTKYLPRTRIFFFLLFASEELLKSAPKIMQFLPSPLLKLNFPCLSNPILYSKYLY